MAEDIHGETDPPSRPLEGWGRVVVGVTLALLAWSTLAELTRGGTWGAVIWRGISSKTARDIGALDLYDLWNLGQWWRLWTCAWVHGSWVHWTLNTVSWAVLWPLVAGSGGGTRAWMSLTVLNVSVVGASLCAAIAGEGASVLGLSGGLFGLAGVAARLERTPSWMRRDLWVSMGALLFVGWALPWLWPTGPQLSNVGHLGGLACGVLMLELPGVRERLEPIEQDGSRVRVPRGSGEHWFLRGPLWSIALVLVCVAATLGTRRTLFSRVYAGVCLERGALELSQEWWARALLVAPEDPELLNAMGYTLAVQGRELERAAALVERALAAEPDNASFLDSAGWISCVQGEVTYGAKILRRALELEESETTQVHLDRCREAVQEPYVEARR